MGLVCQLFAIQIQMFQDAQIDKVTAAAANFDVVFLLNVEPNLSVVTKAPEIETLENRSRIHGERLEPPRAQKRFSFRINQPSSRLAVNGQIGVVIDLVNELLAVSFDFFWIDFQ